VLGDNMKEKSSEGKHDCKKPSDCAATTRIPGERPGGGSHGVYRTTVALAGAQKLNPSFPSPGWETGNETPASDISQ